MEVSSLHLVRDSIESTVINFIHFAIILGGMWYTRVKFLDSRKTVQYVKETSCFPYCGRNDLDQKLYNIQTKDLLNHQDFVLSLIVLFDKRQEWENATALASKLRNVYPDYRFSLLTYRTINSSNYSKRWSYVCTIFSSTILN